MIGKMLRKRKHTNTWTENGVSDEYSARGLGYYSKRRRLSTGVEGKAGKRPRGGNVEHYRTKRLHGGIKSSGLTTPALCQRSL